MKGLLRTILDDHRDAVLLRHAVKVFACMLNFDNNAMYVSFDDPLLDSIVRKIEDLKIRVSENHSNGEI